MLARRAGPAGPAPPPGKSLRPGRVGDREGWRVRPPTTAATNAVDSVSGRGPRGRQCGRSMCRRLLRRAIDRPAPRFSQGNGLPLLRPVPRPLQPGMPNGRCDPDNIERAHPRQFHPAAGSAAEARHLGSPLDHSLLVHGGTACRSPLDAGRGKPVTCQRNISPDRDGSVLFHVRWSPKTAAPPPYPLWRLVSIEKRVSPLGKRDAGVERSDRLVRSKPTAYGCATVTGSPTVVAVSEINMTAGLMKTLRAYVQGGGILHLNAYQMRLREDFVQAPDLVGATIGLARIESGWAGGTITGRRIYTSNRIHPRVVMPGVKNAPYQEPWYVMQDVQPSPGAEILAASADKDGQPWEARVHPGHCLAPRRIRRPNGSRGRETVEYRDAHRPTPAPRPHSGRRRGGAGGEKAVGIPERSLRS
jgi:hypothetical protein